MTPCIEWGGAVTESGYGRRYFRGKMHRAHRVAYIQEFGEIPAGLVVCHACDNRRCINHDHLWLGTQQENAADCARKGRSLRGERNSFAKLTEVDVRNIRSRAVTDPTQQIASDYGVHETTIQRIVRRATWGHVE